MPVWVLYRIILACPICTYNRDDLTARSSGARSELMPRVIHVLSGPQCTQRNFCERFCNLFMLAKSKSGLNLVKPRFTDIVKSFMQFRVVSQSLSSACSLWSLIIYKAKVQRFRRTKQRGRDSFIWLLRVSGC